MHPVVQKLGLCLKAGYPYVHLQTWEERRALRELGEPRPGRQGFGAGMAEHGDSGMTASGGWGFMPGTGRCLDLLQFEPNWRSLRDHQEDRRDSKGRLLAPSANWSTH